MPPSPRLRLSIDQAKYAALCESMGITNPPTVATSERGGRIYGTYQPLSNVVTIYHGQDFFTVNRMRAVALELASTLLHELRHAWQDQEWGFGHYEANVVRAENDANEYAAAHAHEWRSVIRIGRTHAYKKLPG